MHTSNKSSSTACSTLTLIRATYDDGRIALIDLGMVGRISPTMQERLLKLLLAVTDAKGDEAAEITAAMGRNSRSLIVGAAMIMRVETSFRLFGSRD